MMSAGRSARRTTMYFSDRNEKTIYINHFSGLLEVKGTGDLTVEDTKVSPCDNDDWGAEFDTLSVTEGITDIREGFLDAFPNIECLILRRSVTSVAATPELISRLKRNNVLIRGEYDTCAEEFAKKHDLEFLHCDIPLADSEDEHERDIITLRFHYQKAPDIHHNIFTSGSSAGNYGGGEVASELPKNFFVGCTVEKFANIFPVYLHDQLMANDMLRRFFDTANKRRGRK